MIIFGTRPEAIKMAPVIKELQKEEKLETVVVVTAQHREMLDQVLDLFDITPHYDLDIMKEKQSLSGITINVLKGLENVYNKEKPDLILVHGDTTTTLTAALASYYQQVKVGHVEAGLRTYNKFSPFPEEMNRHLTGVLADIHFAPTVNNKENLIRENIDKNKIFLTGNTVIDALKMTINSDYIFANRTLKNIDFANKRIILLTAHRRENLGKPMENIFTAVREIACRNEDVEVVFPVHLNPAVRNLVNKILADIDNVHLIEPLTYQSFANLMNRSYLVLTDSGGVQEEAPGLGKPVLVLRDTTERPEAISAGTVKMVGTDRDKIIDTVQTLLEDNNKYRKMSNAVNPYGDGKASRRIRNRILYEFALITKKGEEFRGG